MRVTEIKKIDDVDIVVIDQIEYIRIKPDYWLYPDWHRGQVTNPNIREELEAAYQKFKNPPFEIQIDNCYVILYINNFIFHLAKCGNVEEAEHEKFLLTQALNSLIDKE